MSTEFRPSRRQVLAGGAGLSLAAFLTACGAGSSGGGGTTVASGGSDNLIVAWPTDADSYDPQNSTYSFMDWDLDANLYQTLVNCKFVADGNGVYAWNGLELAPSMAKSWVIKDDTVTFTLDDTVKFYPTNNPLTADDVVYSYQRVFDRGNGSLLNIAGIYKPSQIVKVDTHTVKMNMTDPDGNAVPVSGFLLAPFRFPNMPIVDSVEVKKHVTKADPTATNWLKTNTAGTGPYYVKSRTIGQQIQLAAVPNHPLNPAYKTVTIQVAGNVLSLVKGGSVNLAVYGMTEEDVDSLKGDSAVTVNRVKAPELFQLQLPVDAGGPFANQLVRQAIAYTIPYDQIIKSLFAGSTTKADSMVVVGSNGYSPAWAGYTTDIAKAKALMVQAGNPKISSPLHFQNGDPTMQSMAILIKQAAAQIGVSFTLTPETAANATAIQTARNTGGKGPADAFLYKWGDWEDDPSITMQYFFTKTGVANYTHWSDPRVDATSKKWFAKPASAARAADYVAAQKIVADACPIIPIVHSNRTVVTTKGISGVTVSPEMCVRFWPLTPTTA